jgi:hypothetical protein
LDNIPEKTDPISRSDLIAFKNKETNKVDYINIKTGKIHELYKPLDYIDLNNELVDLICNDIIAGKTLGHVLHKHKVEAAMFYGWLAVFPQIKRRYIEARKQRADFFFDEIISLSDNLIEGDLSRDQVSAYKTALDAKKWLVEKSDPERFNRPKEEINNNSSITINLRTGVHDIAPPPNMNIDQFGNFLGFQEEFVDEGSDRERSEQLGTGTVELDRNRFGVYEEKDREEEQ